MASAIVASFVVIACKDSSASTTNAVRIVSRIAKVKSAELTGATDNAASVEQAKYVIIRGNASLPAFRSAMARPVDLMDAVERVANVRLDKTALEATVSVNASRIAMVRTAATMDAVGVAVRAVPDNPATTVYAPGAVLRTVTVRTAVAMDAEGVAVRALKGRAV